MTCEDHLKKKTALIKKVIEELNLDYSLEYILENFKSIVIATESKRVRMAAVVRVDEKKTKRIYIKTIAFKNSEEATEKFGDITKCSIFVQLYRSIKILNELVQLDKGLKMNNSQLIYNGINHYKELGSIV